MNEIIRFQPNVPVEIALKYSTGKRVQDRYGEQYFFSLVDGRAMYLDADVGLVSTVLIQAARDGFLELWERAA